MDWRQVYLGLGGNIGDSLSILKHALKSINAMDQVRSVKVSCFYQTTPVSDIEQGLFVNAVCSLETSLGPKHLFQELERIERELGKRPKSKNEARKIDIDLLFYGTERYSDEGLEIPHPRWRDRLFVIKPLSELVQTIWVPGPAGMESVEEVDLMNLLRVFPNKHDESVILLSEE